MIELDLTGQRALITGGASGIGLTTAHVLRRAGAECVLLDKEPVAEAGMDSLQVDLTNLQEISSALATLPPVDILVNSAGLLGAPRMLHDSPIEHFEASWAVNLRAPMVLARTLVPAMKERGRGVVVNVASIAAFRGSGTDPAYAAMKAGLVALTRSLAAQYGPFGVRVLAVCPGSVRGTRLLERARGHGLTQAETIGLLQRLPLRRTVGTEDVANLIAFLVSPLASAMTGVAVTIDAGERST